MLKSIHSIVSREYLGSWGKKKGRFYWRSLAWILAVSSLPGMISGFILYWVGDTRIERELHQLHASQIEKRAQNVDDQFAYLELSLAHWAFDPKFNGDLKDVNFNSAYQQAWDISKTLMVMQGSHPLAKKVELYLQRPKPVVFNPEYNLLLNQEAILPYVKNLSPVKEFFWTNWIQTPIEEPTSANVDLTLVHKLYGGSPEPFGALIVHLNRDKIINLLQTLTPYDQGETFLLEHNGNIFVSANNSPESMKFEGALKEKVRSLPVGHGSFLYKWGKDTYAVSYGNLSRIGEAWTYVSAVPVDAITAPVIFLSKLLMGVSLLLLILVGLLSWIASKRIHSPVDRLVRLFSSDTAAGDQENDEFGIIETNWHHLTRESKALQNKLEEQLPHMKESFLLQLFRGYLYSYSEQELIDRMEHFGWTVDQHQFLTVYIHLTGFSNLEGRFSQGDEGLVTFVAANIIQEFSLKRFEQADLINFHDMTIGMLVVASEDHPYTQNLREFTEEITQAINLILKMQVVVAISRSSSSIASIPDSFEQAIQALSYRKFENQNQMIDLEQLGETEVSYELRYPFQLEREIIQKMRTGEQEEAVVAVKAFLKALQENNALEIDVQTAMLTLLGSIHHAIMLSGVNPGRIYKDLNMFDELSQIREPDQMSKWFDLKVIQPYIREMEARSDYENKRMVERLMIYMQEQYMTELSLDQCAEQFGTNSYYLSRTFKRVVGKNFIDYLTELRLEKAKELLSDTEWKINEVAERVGYQHSYFNRIFKKQEGVTPTHYREISKNQ
ncbi:AraC-type DNA-binding protein [Paenibacillus sp. 1_12]|uniref:AraC family transcriptional regulator n=1 Tax=Paenibacillus sp. 1_12 TaxID=1566278 RepID=UPI0008F32F25|nr:AraC family transcriptional regulator [Paenibacillus sp. 1_12]SFK99329.1 AraC-type DNA-binding protein [Paenibacillus sp. 1_12]